MVEIKTTKDMRAFLKNPKNIFEARDLLYELGDNVSREVIDIDHETTLFEEVYKIELEDGTIFASMRITLTVRYRDGIYEMESCGEIQPI